MRSLTYINTGPVAADLILGFGSGHQVQRVTQVAPNATAAPLTWLVWETGETMQWQISASSFQVSLHGQLLLLP